MSLTQLNELYMEMEVLIREFSETLINELALRDELEYEKEMKNTFISLLLAVQNKRRQFHVEKKRNKTQGKTTANGDLNLFLNSMKRCSMLTIHLTFFDVVLQVWNPNIWPQ